MSSKCISRRHALQQIAVGAGSLTLLGATLPGRRGHVLNRPASPSLCCGTSGLARLLVRSEAAL